MTKWLFYFKHSPGTNGGADCDFVFYLLGLFMCYLSFLFAGNPNVPMQLMPNITEYSINPVGLEHHAVVA